MKLLHKERATDWGLDVLTIVTLSCALVWFHTAEDWMWPNHMDKPCSSNSCSFGKSTAYNKFQSSSLNLFFGLWFFKWYCELPFSSQTASVNDKCVHVHTKTRDPVTLSVAPHLSKSLWCSSTQTNWLFLVSSKKSSRFLTMTSLRTYERLTLTLQFLCNN